ncbi:MAG: glycosyltransferase [Sediminibacterium sp.]|nr:glycosyltransferase [Sediminibacterium sp.]
MDPHLAEKNIVLFHSHGKIKNSGGATYIQLLFEILSQIPGVHFTIVYTDCEEVTEVTYKNENTIEIIRIPQPVNKLFLSYEKNLIQDKYCERLINILHPVLADKQNLIFWFNNPDEINLLALLKQTYTCQAVYVLHSWAWKELINMDDAFFYRGKVNSLTVELHDEFLFSQINMCHIADRIITLTNYSKNVLINKFNFTETKITTIYNGVRVPHDKAVSKENIIKEFGFSNDDKIILYSGRLHDNKGISFLISAFKIINKIIPEARLVLIGPGDISKFLQESFPLLGRISFTGMMGKEAVYKLYSIAKIGVIPSLFEQCSFTSIEMSQFRIPLIVTEIEGLDEMFANFVDSLKVPLTVNAHGERLIVADILAEKIQSLLTDTAMAGKIAFNGYKKSCLLFSYQQMKDRYFNFIETLYPVS